MKRFLHAQSWASMSSRGAGQYLLEYGTGKFATVPSIVFVLPSYRATGYLECSVMEAIGYDTVMCI